MVAAPFALARACVFVSVLWTLSIVAFSHQDYQFLMFKNMKCMIEPKFAYQNFSCQVKSFNRSYSTFSIVDEYKFPLYNIFGSCHSIFSSPSLFQFTQIKASRFYKYGVIYREALRIPRFDLCSLMKTNFNLRLISQILKLWKDSAPGMIHKRPYNVSAFFARLRALNDSKHFFYRV